MHIDARKVDLLKQKMYYVQCRRLLWLKWKYICSIDWRVKTGRNTVSVLMQMILTFIKAIYPPTVLPMC